MHRNMKYLITTIFVLMIQGCVAPGSSVGILKIQGELTNSQEKPISNREIEFMLPAAYGLGGLDLIMNSPEDFGHKDQKFKTVTDEQGRFQVDLGGRIYHVSVWILPPLGGFPKRPPPLFLLARFPNNQSEYYAIQTHDGQFKIYDYAGAEIPIGKSLIESIDAYDQEGNSDNTRETIGVINFKIKSE